MTVAYIMMIAVEHFAKRMNQKVLKAIERHKKARAIGWKLLKDERYKITAQPPMTLKDAKKLVEEYGLTWKDFGPYYNRAKKKEQKRRKRNMVLK